MNVDFEKKLTIPMEVKKMFPLTDDMRDVIEVDVRTELIGQLIIRSRCHIRGEHDITARKAACICHLQLSQ